MFKKIIYAFFLKSFVLKKRKHMAKLDGGDLPFLKKKCRAPQLRVVEYKKEK